MLLCIIIFPTFASTAAAGMTPKAGSGADLGGGAAMGGLGLKMHPAVLSRYRVTGAD